MHTEKTLKRKIGEGALWMSGSSVLMKVIGIAYVILILSKLSVHEYGLVELTLSILPMFGILSLTGLQPVIIADLVSLGSDGKKEEMRDLLSSYISLKLILTILSISGLLLSTVVFGDYFHDDIISMVRLLVFSLFINPFKSLIHVACSVTHNFKVLSLFSLSGEVIKLCVVIVLFQFISYGPLVAVLAFVISDVATGFLFMSTIFTLKHNMLGGKILTKKIFEPLCILKGHAKWSVLQVGIYSYGQNARPWIIQFFLGTQAVGIFGVAMGMYQHTSSLFPLARVVAPIIPRYLEKKNKLIEVINHSIKYQLLALMSAVIVMIILMPLLLLTFFPDYMNAYPLFVLLTTNLIVSSFSRVFETAFHALKLQKDLFVSIVVNTILTILILPAAIMMFGLNGVAVELFITGLVYTISRYKVLKNVLPNYSFKLRTLCTVSSFDVLILGKIKDNFMRGFKKFI